jgi:large conductance mechanosensitive channel
MAKQKDLGNNFREFIEKQEIVAFTVGLIVGGAVKSVVNSFVEDIFDPFVGLFLPQSDSLDTYSVEVLDSTFKIGSFLSNLIDFLVLALIVYLVFSKLKKDTEKKITK